MSTLRISTLVLILGLSVLGHIGCAEEPYYGPRLWDSPDFPQPSLLASFANGARMGTPQSSNKSLILVKLAEEALTVKTYYIEKGAGDGSKNLSTVEQAQGQFKAIATSSLIDQLLNAEGEFASSAFSAKSFAEIKDYSYGLFRLRGSWSGFSYGAEYRSVGPHFINLAGPMITVDQEGGEVWAQQKLGMFAVKASLADFANNVAQDSSSTRTTKLQGGALVSIAPPSWPVLNLFYTRGLLASSEALAESQSETRATDSVGTSLHFRAGLWDATLSSTYSLSNITSRSAGFPSGSQLSMSRVQTDTPFFSLNLNYRPSILPVQVATFGSYSKTKSSGGYKNSDALNLSGSLVWKLGEAVAGKNTLSLGATYNRHLDAVDPTNSTKNVSENVSVWLRLKIPYN